MTACCFREHLWGFGGSFCRPAAALVDPLTNVVPRARAVTPGDTGARLHKHRCEAFINTPLGNTRALSRASSAEASTRALRSKD